MKLTKICYILMFILMFSVIGCSHIENGFQTDYPMIETGINVTDSYKNLHDKYETLLEHVNKNTQKYMVENIAPILNRTKKEIIDYNEYVLAGHKDQEKRKMIIEKLREISRELLKIEEN